MKPESSETSRPHLFSNLQSTLSSFRRPPKKAQVTFRRSKQNMKIPIRTTEAQHHEQNRTTVSDGFLSTRRIPALIMVAVILMLSLTTIYSRPVSADLTSSYGELWVTQQAAGRISILHPQSVLAGSAVETISLPAGAHPHITTFSPDSKFAYVSDMGNGTLYVIRADDREIVGALHLAPTL